MGEPSLRAHRHCERSEATQEWQREFLQHCALQLLDCFAALAMTGDELRDPAVYIMASKRNGTIYTGVTGQLALRVFQHREGSVPGFTKRYGCKLLVWYERYDLVVDAIAREKQIKAGSRSKKLELIEAMNPQWRDLHDDLAQ